MPTVLITTDFSAVSRHSLDYACQWLQGKQVTLDLLHIYPIPAAYTSDGVSIAAMRLGLDHADDLMDEELRHARETWPGLNIAGRVITGSFLETLRQEARDEKPLFIVLGTAGFADLYFGDVDPLNALRSMPAPVLFVPRYAELKPMHNVAYACNYAGVGEHTPVHEITDWVRRMQVSLEVVHTNPQSQSIDEKQAAGEQWLRAQLAPLHPGFYLEQNEDVLHGIVNFVAEHHIDCVLMVPKKHGMWERLFHESRTKALARFNRIPVIAFHPLSV